MIAIIHGLRALDFTAEDGKKIKGTQLFVTFEEEGVTGHATDKLFAKAAIELPEKLQVGSEVEIFFDRKGKVAAVYDSTE